MRAHTSTLLDRMRRASTRVSHLRYRVVAAGIDHRGRVISLRTNTPRFPFHRGWPAEELLIHSSPRSLSTIILARFGRRGDLLPIHPCPQCRKLADKFGVKIERVTT